MHPNIQALIAALKSLGRPFSPIPGFEDGVMAGDKAFVRAGTPFNAESAAILSRDKAAVYAVLGAALSGKAPMPRTMSFVDPTGSHADQSTAISIDDIVARTADFGYPRIIKMNAGERGTNVFFIENDAEARLAFENIFDKRSRHYDYMALVQQYIDIKNEWRVAVAAGEPSFAYAKETFEMAPIDLYLQLEAIARTVAAALGISWGAIDIIESKTGRLYFIESNTKPGYGGFIAKYGIEKISDLYVAALKDLEKKKSVQISGALRISVQD